MMLRRETRLAGERENASGLRDELEALRAYRVLE
jgi:hypothetical protein